MRTSPFKMRRRWIGVAIKLGGLGIVLSEFAWLGSA